MKYINFKDWKVHAMCLALVLASEFIGIRPVALGAIKFSLLPMLYALVFGIILAMAKVIKPDMMSTASPCIGISVMYLTAKMGTTIGPNLAAVTKAGPALILQEAGNVGTVLFSLPIAILVFKMGRQAVGACFSISREGSIAVVGNLYGLDGPEGQGVMGAYITGTLIGTIFNGIMASLCVASGLFHPFSLGMAAGTGSASMMTAALGPVVDAFPQMADQITAYAAGSQVLSSIDGLYINLFISIPLTEWMYRKLKGEKKPAKAKA